jgi:hypothetical protein
LINGWRGAAPNREPQLLGPRRRHLAGTAILVDRDKGELGFGHPDPFASTLPPGGMFALLQPHLLI